MSVEFLPEALEYFNELSTILFEEEYFGFEESALSYVDDLVDDIERSLHTKIKKKAPPYFNRYGRNMQYAAFRKNKATEWYVFFTKYKYNGEVIYLVRYISNNHVIAKYL